MGLNQPEEFLIADRAGPESRTLATSLRTIATALLVDPFYVVTSEFEDPSLVDDAALRARHLHGPTPRETACAWLTEHCRYR